MAGVNREKGGGNPSSKSKVLGFRVSDCYLLDRSLVLQLQT